MKKVKDIYILLAAFAGIYFLNGAINQKGILGFYFDHTIRSLDQLKKDYFRLAKKYHPDAGGTTQQFQELQAEHERLLKTILNSSSLSDEEKHTEKEVDEHIRAVLNSVVNLEGINVELIGKWIWISGNTFPLKDQLKALKFIFFKKDNTPYWVFKGAESTGRGKMSLEEIKAKYGATKYKGQSKNYINGFFDPVEFYYHMEKLQQHLKNRK